MLVTAYLVERGLILNLYEVESKTNEITALPECIKQLVVQGVVFAFDAISWMSKPRSHPLDLDIQLESFAIH